ncbi:MAG: hypothetical protein LBV30_05060 [Propionibacteriaceae bacterium]|jgi:plasmid stability protein|nr:hypothetical protein [Propionibacteriaceae bacterium]
MSQTLGELINSEIQHAIAQEDVPYPDDVVVTRPNRGTVLSVRLTGEELSRLTESANAHGLPISTEGRRIILAALNGDDMTQTMEAAIRATIRPEYLTGPDAPLIKDSLAA